MQHAHSVPNESERGKNEIVRIDAAALGLAYGYVSGWTTVPDGSRRFALTDDPVSGTDRVEICPNLVPYSDARGVYELTRRDESALVCEIEWRREEGLADLIMGRCEGSSTVCGVCVADGSRRWRECSRSTRREVRWSDA